MSLKELLYNLTPDNHHKHTYHDGSKTDWLPNTCGISKDFLNY